MVESLSFEKPLELYLRLKINCSDTIKLPLLFVVEVNKSDKQIFYRETLLEQPDSLLKKWVDLDCKIKLPDEVTFKGVLKTYLLNRNKGTYLLDDYQLGYCYKR